MSNVMSFNGACGKDAEIRHTPSGALVLSVTVANKIGFGDKQKILWIRINVWGKRAEGHLKNHLKKGQLVFVSGELSQSEYKANDGTTKTSLELNATIVDLIGKKSESDLNTQTSPHNQHRSAKPPQANEHLDFDDIPF